MSSLKKEIKKETKTIWILVLLLHVSFLIFLPTDNINKKSKSKKIYVNTKTVVEKKDLTESKIPCVAKIIDSPLPKVLQKKSHEIKKNIKKELLRKKEIKKKPAAAKEVLKKIDKRLQKTEAITKKKDTPLINKETFIEDYIEKATSIFRESLSMPEKGIVKLTITVLTNGKIDKIEIETYESKKNLDYLMAVLPTLSMPTIEKGFDATFTVLFCSD